MGRWQASSLSRRMYFRAMPSLMSEDRVRAVIMPLESYGLCRIQTCRVVGDLAESLCVTHWDRGLDQPIKRKRQRKRTGMAGAAWVA